MKNEKPIDYSIPPLERKAKQDIKNLIDERNKKVGFILWSSPRLKKISKSF